MTEFEFSPSVERDVGPFPHASIPQASAPPASAPTAPALTEDLAADIYDDIIRNADAIRTAAGQRLQELVWTHPDGSRSHPELTSSRWVIHQWLCAGLGDQYLDEEAALQQQERLAGITAGLLLFLCISPSRMWEMPRPGDVPLLNDRPAFLRAGMAWIDRQIPMARMGEAIALANALTDHTWSALPTVIAEDDPDADPQKKTPPRAGKTGI